MTKKVPWCPSYKKDVFFYKLASCIYSFAKKKDLNVDSEMSINEGAVLCLKCLLGNVIETTVVINPYSRTCTLAGKKVHVKKTDPTVAYNSEPDTQEVIHMIQYLIDKITAHRDVRKMKNDMAGPGEFKLLTC